MRAGVALSADVYRPISAGRTRSCCVGLCVVHHDHRLAPETQRHYFPPPPRAAQRGQSSMCSGAQSPKQAPETGQVVALCRWNQRALPPGV